MKVGCDQNDQQFFGSLSNLEIFGGSNALNLSIDPCKEEQNIALAWDLNHWKTEGTNWLLTGEHEGIMSTRLKLTNLAITPMMTIRESLDLCKEKLNDSFIPFQDDLDTFLKYVAWHKKTTTAVHCTMIPLSTRMLR